jgi:hypothetical protein
MERRKLDGSDGDSPGMEIPGAEIETRDPDGLAALERAIGAFADRVRAAPVPDLSERVMARIAAGSRPSTAGRVAAAVVRWLDWLWAPRPVQVRPAFGMAALMVLALFAVAAPRGLAPTQRDAMANGVATPSVSLVYVQFRLEARGATQVALAGSFTGWQPEYQLRETAPGTWSILLPLGPGIHDYAFVVDGREWVADPHALRIDDGFGGSNSRIALPAAPRVDGQRS